MGPLRNGIGWFAVALSLTASCGLAGLAIRHALLEGWWAPSVLENLGMMASGLLVALIPALFGLIAIGWPRIGGLLQVVVGVIVFVFPLLTDGGLLPNPNHPHLSVFLEMHLSGMLLAIMGIAYLKGRPRPRWLAVGLLAGLPIAVSLVCAVEPMWRIRHRHDDGGIMARRVEGNGVELIWAPAGPGWPRQGEANLEESEEIVSRLTEDGMSLTDSPRNIWRLPTVDEVIRSLTRNGQNAGGEWNPESGQARYRVTPDKESPLWRVRSPVVRWWTSSRIPEWPDGHVRYTVSYDGEVLKVYTFISSANLGFRAVKAQNPKSKI